MVVVVQTELEVALFFSRKKKGVYIYIGEVVLRRQEQQWLDPITLSDA